MSRSSVTCIATFLVAAMLAGCATTQTTATAPAEAAESPDDAESTAADEMTVAENTESEDEELVCRTIRQGVTGSRLSGRKKECKTQAQWDWERDQARRDAETAKDQLSTPPAPTLSPGGI